jgi:transcription-repair coupling factor (superfamily II helicase)
LLAAPALLPTAVLKLHTQARRPQEAAAFHLSCSLNDNQHIFEMLCRSCRYVLAEFADEVTEREPLELAEELIKRFKTVPPGAQALLLTAVLKLRMHAMNDTALRARAHAFFKAHTRSPDVELQQRAFEYLTMSELGESSVVMRETVLAPMPD